LPQLINAVLSLPQLLKIIPCPRHRLPILDKKTGKLNYSNNLTLINAWLFVLGPRTEKQLSTELIAFQVFCGAFAFFVRYYLASLVYI